MPKVYGVDSKSVALGKEDEIDFVNFFTKYYSKRNSPIIFIKSEKKEDKNKHYDFIVKGKVGETKVDVKGLKSLPNKRYSGEPKGKCVFVEFLNNFGNAGWIDGEADIIAHKVLYNGKIYWGLMKREALKNYALKKCHNFNEPITTPDKVSYNDAYSRQKCQNNDLCVMLSVEDLVIDNIIKLYVI